MTEIVFITKLFDGGEGRLAFYVPKNVIAFYDLQVPKGGLAVTGTIKSASDLFAEPEELPDMGTKLYRYNGGIRGVIPRWTTMPEAGTLVQIVINAMGLGCLFK